MPVLSSLNHVTLHVISWGTLLGTQFFQSFVGGFVAYKTISPPQFSLLQQNIFPVYFTLTSGLSLLVLVTHPHTSWDSLIYSSSALPMAITFVASTVNLFIVGPKTTQVMKERKIQETKDGRKKDDPEQSEEMKALNRRFEILHGVSAMLGVAAWGATAWYGVRIADGMNHGVNYWAMQGRREGVRIGEDVVRRISGVMGDVSMGKVKEIVGSLVD